MSQAKEVALVFDRKWYVCLSYEDDLQIEEQKQGVTTSIGPGEIHSIVSVNENGDSLVITGRYMRSIHRLRNKKSKELQERMNRCEKALNNGENTIEQRNLSFLKVMPN